MTHPQWTHNSEFDAARKRLDAPPSAKCIRNFPNPSFSIESLILEPLWPLESQVKGLGGEVAKAICEIAIPRAGQALFLQSALGTVNNACETRHFSRQHWISRICKKQLPLLFDCSSIAGGGQCGGPLPAFDGSRVAVGETLLEELTTFLV